MAKKKKEKVVEPKVDVSALVKVVKLPQATKRMCALMGGDKVAFKSLMLAAEREIVYQQTIRKRARPEALKELEDLT
jgi:hypothetical protein